MNHSIPVLIAVLLAASLGACQKKEESTPMPEVGAPSVPAPETGSGGMGTPPAPAEGAAPQPSGQAPAQ
jgi:hypothetical protein